MVRTKQTARGSKAPRPEGMTTTKFAGKGRGRGDPEEQFADDPFDIADEDLPDVLEDADKPKGDEPSTSKSVGKEGEAHIGQANRKPKAKQKQSKLKLVGLRHISKIFGKLLLSP